MTPKEKAIELVDKFYDFEYLKLDYEQAKQCALIVVCEILDTIPDVEIHNSIIDYCQDVKQKIHQL